MGWEGLMEYYHSGLISVQNLFLEDVGKSILIFKKIIRFVDMFVIVMQWFLSC